MIQTLNSWRTKQRSHSTAVILFFLALHYTFAINIPSSLTKKLLGESDYNDFGAPNGGSNSEMPDNSIDPDKYLVGGGDCFQISIIGLPSQEFFPTINQDGDIFVGDFGIIKLGKISLTQAKDTIRKRVQKTLRNKYDIYVTLIRIKKPIVTVTGELLSPGTFQMGGTMRLLDALKMANKGALPAIEEFNFREVEVRKGDSIWTYDLLRFLANIDLTQNPYVYPGDNIMLHRIDKHVYIKGEISSPFEGRISLRKDETLADLLLLVTLKSSADSNFILIQQFDASGKAAPVRKVSISDAALIVLNDRDVIIIGVKENYVQTGTVTVGGEVVRPGTFPILENGTTAGDMLRLAGGLRGNGNLARAYVIKAKIFPGIRENVIKLENRHLSDYRVSTQKDAALAALRKIRPEDNTALTDLNTLNDCMIIDIGDNSDATPVQDGDQVYIPKKGFYVYVSGTVRNPGPYLFKEGKRFSYYVEQAGGYTRKSDVKNEFVLTTYQDYAKIKDNSRVVEGDILVIPNSVEYKTFNSVWLPILQFIPSIISLALSTYIISNQIK